jgi:SulP family sulfate permease
VDGHRVTVLLAGVRPDTLKVLRNIGFDDWFPAEQVFPEEDQKYSAPFGQCSSPAKLGIDEPGQRVAELGRERSADPLYYLV